MARPRRQTVEYFFHYCRGGKTLFILEGKYGNDGYAFWFKLLELLGETEGHYYDCSKVSNWEFLLAKTRITGEMAESIIGTLIDLGKVDGRLWREKRILWVERFVNYLGDLYKRRRESAPSRPDTGPNTNTETSSEESFCMQKPSRKKVSGAETIVSDAETPQRRVEKSRVEKSREEKEGEEREEAVVSLWNSTLGDLLPKVAVLSEGRRQQISARLAELSPDSDEALQQVQALFDKVRASRFLLGDNDRNWTITIDWLFHSSENIAKVLEGNYDDKRGIRSQATHPDITLGADERIETDGRRTYGTGVATVPPDAPPRPSARHQWDANALRWMFI